MATSPRRIGIWRVRRVWARVPLVMLERKLVEMKSLSLLARKVWCWRLEIWETRVKAGRERRAASLLAAGREGEIPQAVMSSVNWEVVVGEVMGLGWMPMALE